MGNIVVETKRSKRKSEEDEENEEDGSLIKRIKLTNSSDYIYNSLFCQSDGSDVTFEAFQKQWKLHRSFLCKFDYFKNMFKECWPESKLSLIHFHFTDDLINQESFGKVMESMYTDVIKLDATNTPSIMATASWFGMEELLEHTVSFLQDNLSYSTVLSCLSHADIYNQKQFYTKCIEFLARNLFIKTSINILKHLSCDMMTEILSNTHLCVINLEGQVYDLLKSWLYLKVDLNFKGTLQELVTCRDVYFKDLVQGKNAAYLEEHHSLSSAFTALRITNAMCIKKFCINVARDNILPKEWLLKSYEYHCKRLIEAFSPCADRLPNIRRDLFEKHATRCGRALSHNGKHYWKWDLLDYGYELFFSWADNCLSITKKNAHGFSPQSNSKVYYRYEVFSLNSDGRVTYCFQSDVVLLPLLGTRFSKIKDIPDNPSLYLSCRILRTSLDTTDPPPYFFLDSIVPSSLPPSIESNNHDTNSIPSVSDNTTPSPPTSSLTANSTTLGQGASSNENELNVESCMSQVSSDDEYWEEFITQRN